MFEKNKQKGYGMKMKSFMKRYLGNGGGTSSNVISEKKGLGKNFTLMCFLISAVFLCAILCVFRIFVIKENYEVGLNYYAGSYIVKSGMLKTVFDVCFIVLVAAFFLISLCFSKSIDNGLNCDSPFMAFGSSFSGVAILLFTGMYIYRLQSGQLTANKAFYVYLAFLLATAIWFVFSATNYFNTKSPVIAICSLIPSVCIALKLLIDFIATTDTQSWNSVLYHLLGLVAILLFFANESRFIIRRGSPSLYIFFGLLTILCFSVYAIPDIILSFFWVLEGKTLINTAIDLFLMVYVLCRLFALKTYANDADGSIQ